MNWANEIGSLLNRADCEKSLKNPIKGEKKELNKKMKTFSKVFAVTLALMILLTSMTTAFAATRVTSGKRATTGRGLLWAVEASYTYKDAQGKSHTYHTTPGSNVAAHYFAAQNETLQYSDYTQRAFCIQPALPTENAQSEDGVTHNSPYYYNGTIESGGYEAYDKDLSKNQKSLLAMVLANGYGGLVAPTKENVAYYYATQMLVFETVMGVRSVTNFDPIGSYPNVLRQPSKCFKADSFYSAQDRETTPAAVESAYNTMVTMLKDTLGNPNGTIKNRDKAPVHQMTFHPELNNQYVYYMPFDDIVRTDYSTWRGTDIKSLNIQKSDIQVESGSVKINVKIDNENKRVIFASYSPIPKDTNVIVSFTHPRRRGLNAIAKTRKYGSNGLILSTMNDSPNVQCFATGRPALNPAISYMKLVTDNSLVLRLKKKSANPDLTEGNSCYSLKGAKYGIYWTKEDAENNTNCAGMLVTDENGEATYSNSQGTHVPPRDYWTKELEASPGFEIDQNVYQFTDSGEVDTDNVPIYEVLSKEIPASDPMNIFLRKYNVVTGASEKRTDLGGAVFEVKFYDGEYTSWEEVKDLNALRTWYFISNDNGVVQYRPDRILNTSEYPSDELYTDHNGFPNLPAGSLSVKEVKAPAGYLVNDSIMVQPINKFNNFDEDNNPENPILFDETPIGGLTITKKSDDNLVSDIYFEVAKEGGEVVGTYGTTGSGVIKIDGLQPGNYTITELGFKQNDGSYKIPKRYTPEQNPQVVTVGENGDANVTFVNHVPMGRIDIYKGSDDGIIKGIYFKVTNNKGLSKQISTNANGYASAANLPVYDENDNFIVYTVSEIGVRVGNGVAFPDRYLTVEDQTVIFDNALSSLHPVKNLRFQNKIKTGNIQIVKSEENGSIANVAFRVESLSAAYSYDEVVVTNGKGICSVNNLPIYDNNDQKIQYKVSEVGHWDEATQQYKLAGYYFRPEDQVVTLKDSYKGENDYEGDAIRVSFKNVKKTFNLDIHKDASDGRIEGIWFNVTSSDGSYNKNHATDANGNASITNLLGFDADGNVMTYTVKELGIKTGSSYHQLKKYYVLEDQSVKGDDYVAATMESEPKTAKVTFTNIEHRSTITVKKTAEDGDVEGLWFSLTDSEGRPHANQATDSQGTLVFDGLSIYNDNDELIQYTVTELGKLKGDGTYELPFKYNVVPPKTLTLDTDVSVITNEVPFENTLKKGSLTLRKLSSDGTPLDGVEFTLYKADGTVVASKTTENGGIAFFDALNQGSYYVEETKTVPGHQLLEGKQAITISGDTNETLNFVKDISNQKLGEIPNTGDNGILFLCIGGVVVLGAGIGAILYFKKRKK